MKEKEFENALKEMNLETLYIPTYWGFDEEENKIIIDVDSIRNCFESKLEEVLNLR